MKTLVLVILAACGGSGGTGRSVAKRAPAVEPTMGICARDRTPGVTESKALLAASADARRRGCPREAMLDAVAARDGGEGTLATLYMQEAGQDAYSAPLVGPGETSISGSELADEAWAKTGFDIYKLDQTVDAIASAIQDGSIAASERESGRLARLIVRYSPAMPCLPTAGTKRSAEELKQMGQQVRSEVFTRYAKQFLGADDTAMTRVLALASQWACDLAGAAKAYEEVAKREAAAGRKAEALDARLLAWEVRHIPGGFAGRLAISNAPDDLVTQRVRSLEAAGQNTGSLFRAGAEARSALDAIAAEPLDPANAARVEWLRSVIALRMQGNHAEARQLADRAAELATKARRADILDGARMVGALAALELGDADDVERLLADLFASTKLRGALGTRDFLIVWFQNIDKELVKRGRTADRLILGRALRRTAKGYPLFGTFALHDLLGTVLAEMGRVDESLQERLALTEELGARNETSRDVVLSLLAQETTKLRSKLGDSGALDEYVAGTDEYEDPTGYRAVMKGMLDGNLGPMSAFIRSKRMGWEYLTLTDFLCAARPNELIAGAREQLDVWRAEKASPSTGMSSTLQFAQLTQAIGIAAQSLMKCGAAIHSPEVFAMGQTLARTSGMTSEYDDALAAEASNRPEVAASTWKKLNELLLADIGQRESLQTSARAGQLLEHAAAAYLATTPPRVEEAIALLEQSRSRDLRASRAMRRPDQTDPALAPLLDLERKVASARSRIHALATLAVGADPDVAPGLAKAGHAVEADLVRLEAQRDASARKSDAAASRALALAPPNLRQIQARLGEDEVLVYYVVKIIDAWAIVVDKHRATAIPLRARDAEALPALTTAILGYRKQGRSANADRGLVRINPTAAAPSTLSALRAELYDRLVKPLEQAIAPGKRVLIIPDEQTADLAFAELGPPSKPWILRNSIRLLPGTYLLADRAATGSERALVVGDPDFGTSRIEKWQPLPGTRQEAVDVGRRLGATPLLGAGADEAAVKKLLPSATVIHLATHGLADVKRPSMSRIVLGQRSGEDGDLFAYEIERLRLVARLVVLSACETGKGQATGSEGMLALDRAFLVAGAGVVVSSLWVVPDDPTAALMSKFYEELAAKRSADVALANAMTFVRMQPGWSDPQNWAAFRIVGAGLR